jgi:hypothetical protein
LLADQYLTDGRHLVLGDIDGPHHVWLRDIRPGQPLAYGSAPCGWAIGGDRRHRRWATEKAKQQGWQDKRRVGHRRFCGCSRMGYLSDGGFPRRTVHDVLREYSRLPCRARCCRAAS